MEEEEEEEEEAVTGLLFQRWPEGVSFNVHLTKTDDLFSLYLI